MKYIPTAEKVTVEDYPYGFKLRTTLFDTMEFTPKRGYRHVTQTVNPKTNRLNAPKKSTYYDFLLRYKNEDGHIKSIAIDFNKSFEDFDKVAEKIADVWESVTHEEKEYLIICFKQGLRLAMRASIVYAGVPADVIGAEYKKVIKYINSFGNMEEVEGKDVIVSYNTDHNIFSELPEINKQALIEATPKDFNPFKVEESLVV